MSTTHKTQLKDKSAIISDARVLIVAYSHYMNDCIKCAETDRTDQHQIHSLLQLLLLCHRTAHHKTKTVCFPNYRSIGYC